MEILVSLLEESQRPCYRVLYPVLKPYKVLLIRTFTGRCYTHYLFRDSTPRDPGPLYDTSGPKLGDTRHDEIQ